MKKRFNEVIKSHLEEIKDLKKRLTVLPLADFYIGDLIKKFHEVLNQANEELKQEEMHHSLENYEPYKLALELIKFNRTKIPLRKKFEDTDKVFMTYIKNVEKIIEQMNS